MNQCNKSVDIENTVLGKLQLYVY